MEEVDECLSTDHVVWRFCKTTGQQILEKLVQHSEDPFIETLPQCHCRIQSCKPAFISWNMFSSKKCSPNTSNPVWKDRLRGMYLACQVWMKRKCSPANLLTFWSVTWFLHGILQATHSVCQYLLFTLAKGRLLNVKVNQGKLIYQFKLKHGDDGLALL